MTMATRPTRLYTLALDLFTDTDHTITSRSTSAAPFSFSFNVLSQILDGTLNVTLTDNQGGNHDFVFAQSTLAVQATSLRPRRRLP